MYYVEPRESVCQCVKDAYDLIREEKLSTSSVNENPVILESITNNMEEFPEFRRNQEAGRSRKK